MFEKLVAIEPVSLIPSAEEELHRYAKEVVLFRDVPGSDAEMVRRIGDADAVLLSYTSRMGKEVIAQCPNIRYIGMCCSLYSEESANVDIAYARTRGIQVLGIRDYGDRGVVEYVLHELTGLLHGFGMPMLRDEPVEITGLKVGIVGLGVSGRMIADALQFMGAEISYFARSAKPDAEAAGIHGRLIMEMFPNMTVETKCIPDQPDGLHSVESKNAAIPKIIEVAQSFKDIDVLIVSCADDPAVPELKNIVNVPVIGAGSSVAAIARRFGTKVGILGITDYAPQPYLEILGDDLINLGKPDGVETTLDLVTEPGFKAVEKLAMRLKGYGAGAIALACTGMSTAGVAKPLAKKTGLPVIDPVTAEGLMAYYECLSK